jgi:hypothetical protein
MKLIEYIVKNNLNDFFKQICIDNTNNIPKNITVVPTIIDEDIEAPLEGKQAWEYIKNQKFFNHPTNNIDLVKNGVPKPDIEEDKRAINSKVSAFIFDSEKPGDKDDRSQFDKVFNTGSGSSIIPQKAQVQQNQILTPRQKQLEEQRLFDEQKKREELEKQRERDKQRLPLRQASRPAQPQKPIIQPRLPVQQVPQVQPKPAVPSNIDNNKLEALLRLKARK